MVSGVQPESCLTSWSLKKTAACSPWRGGAGGRAPLHPHTPAAPACSRELRRGPGHSHACTQPSLQGRGTFLRRTSVALLTGVSRSVSSLKVNAAELRTFLSPAPDPCSWVLMAKPFGRCNLSSHCHLMGSVRCGGTTAVSCQNCWFPSGSTSGVTRQPVARTLVREVEVWVQSVT